jgi:succinate dehydrogenase / fumarate reductase cytochrome b subunit
MSIPAFDLKRSITKKQIVAISGFLLILFIVVHLAGNLMIYGGSDIFNGYVDVLSSAGSLKMLAEWGLLILFLVHVDSTIRLAVENIRARGGLKRYYVESSKRPRSLSSQLRVYTGIYLLVYLIYHLYDFTWANSTGPLSIIHGINYGLYGLEVNAFKSPWRSFLYVLAMGALGFHMHHGTQSLYQSLGFENHFVARVKKISRAFAIFVALAFSSIPIYVYFFLKI